jgi:hypothetical protein
MTMRRTPIRNQKSEIKPHFYLILQQNNLRSKRKISPKKTHYLILLRLFLVYEVYRIKNWELRIRNWLLPESEIRNPAQAN